jgi:hypothetical protein
MFCPNCGKGEQSRETYCRNCGEFLTDYSGKSYLVNKLLGGQKPETQVTVSLVINLVTIFISMLLLGFLNGFYDAQFERTHVGPPKVIYLVYAFLGLITAWQLFSLVIGVRLRSKLAGRKKLVESDDSKAQLEAVPERALTEGPNNQAMPSIAETTTRKLEPIIRK